MTRQGRDQGKDQDKTRKPAGREARLAAALRENLRRRKAQERGRDIPGEGRPPAKAPDGGRIR
jgi:hypothetical protein